MGLTWTWGAPKDREPGVGDLLGALESARAVLGEHDIQNAKVTVQVGFTGKVKSITVKSV